MLRSSLNILKSNSLAPEGHIWYENNLIEKATNRLYVPIDEKEAVIKEFIHDPQFYGGIRKLYLVISSLFSSITRNDIKDALMKDGLYQSQRPNKAKHSVRSVITTDTNKKAQIDLIDMSSYAGSNNKRTFVLTYIDLFSKYVEAEPILTKSVDHVMEAMDKILKRIHTATGDYPSVIQSDNGPEFGRQFENHLNKKYNITVIHSNPYAPQSQGQIERFNSTLKRYIFRHFNLTDKYRYLEVLPTLIKNVNSSAQKLTGMAPTDVAENGMTDADRKRIVQKQRTRTKPNDDEEKFKVGDYVRVNLNAYPEYRRQKTFRKKIIQNWSLEIYQIAEIHQGNKHAQNPKVFKLYDPSDDTMIKENFYSHQLLLATPTDEAIVFDNEANEQNESDEDEEEVETKKQPLRRSSRYVVDLT